MRTKHQNTTYSPAHSISKQGSRYGPLVCPSKPSSGGLQRICSWHLDMRHSREKESSQRNHHIERGRRRSPSNTPSVSHTWVCLDNWMCRHTEIEVTDSDTVWFTTLLHGVSMAQVQQKVRTYPHIFPSPGPCLTTKPQMGLIHNVNIIIIMILFL